MSHKPDEALLCTSLGALVSAGLITPDPGPARWKSGVYAVVDCVFSAQTRYESVVLPMLRERLPLRPRLADSPVLRFSTFLADVDTFEPDRWEGYGRAVLNLQVLGGRRKVQVCYELSRFLVDRGFETLADLQELGEQALLELVLGPVQSSIKGIGPALARYLAILLGVENQTQPDTMILRFISSLSPWAPRFGSEEDIAVIQRVIGTVAKDTGTTPARLDNAIWRYMSYDGGPNSVDANPMRARRALRQGS